MDKVRFQAQERLDLVDANALQTLIYEYVSEALGGLMGNSGGSLTTLEYTPVEAGGVYTLELGAFQYYHCQPGTLVSITEADGTVRTVPKKYTGQVVSFDPTDEGQIATVDWTTSRSTWDTAAVTTDQTGLSKKKAVHGGHKPGGTLLMPLLWARPYSVDTDTGSRREWSVASQAEVAISISTRTRIRTELRYQAARPEVVSTDANQNQWVAVGRTVAWDYSSATLNANGANIPDAPYIAPIYVWDHVQSYGDYEEQNALESTAMQGRMGHGTARFSMDDGAPGASSHPGTNVNGTSSLETAPFEQDGAALSNLVRGAWVPGSKVGEPSITGAAGTTVGTAAAGASPWPYPGWYDDVAGSWKSLPDSGWKVGTPMWRLGLPHVMHMMRRQMATIMSSNGDRPWYAWPEGGGLSELKAEIDALRLYVDSEVDKLDFVQNLTGSSNISLLAEGKIDFDISNAATFSGHGLTIVEVIRTPTVETVTLTDHTSGATAIVCSCTNANTIGQQIRSVQITPEAYGTQAANSGFHPAEASPGDASKPQGLRGILPMAWVTPGDLQKANTNTRFTIWVTAALPKLKTNATDIVDIRSEVLVEHVALGVPVVTSYLWSLSREGAYGGKTTNFKLGVDFGTQWYSYDTGQTFQIAVFGSASVTETISSTVVGGS